MQRIIRFLIIAQLWAGFNLSVLMKMYATLPYYDRPLFIFVYTTSVILPPIIFFGYLTFVRHALFVHRYELKGFVKKKLRRDPQLLKLLFNLCGCIKASGAGDNPKFDENLKALWQSLNLRIHEIQQAQAALKEGESLTLGSLKRPLKALRKQRGEHLSLFFWVSAVRLERYDEERAYDLSSLRPVYNRLLMFLGLNGSAWYSIELDFALRSYEKDEQSFDHKKQSAGADEADAHLPSDLKEAYAVLGLECGAGFDEVHGAYRKLTFEHHPDRHKHLRQADLQELSDKLIKIRAAYHLIVRFLKKEAA